MGQFLSRSDDRMQHGELDYEEICHGEIDADQLAEETTLALLCMHARPAVSSLEVKFLYEIYYKGAERLTNEESLETVLRHTLQKHSFHNFVHYLHALESHPEPHTLFWHFFLHHREHALPQLMHALAADKHTETRLAHCFQFMHISTAHRHHQPPEEHHEPNSAAPHYFLQKSLTALNRKTLPSQISSKLDSLIMSQRQHEAEETPHHPTQQNASAHPNKSHELLRILPQKNPNSSNIAALHLHTPAHLHAFITKPLDELIISGKEHLNDKQRKLLVLLQNELARCINLHQFQFFSHIVQRIRQFIHQQRCSAPEFEDMLQVQEGKLSITKRWNSYLYHLHGGLISQKIPLPNNPRKPNVVKSFIFVYGCKVERIHGPLPQAHSASTPHSPPSRNQLYILKLTRPKNLPDILFSSRDKSTFDRWYWTLLYYTLETQHNRYDSFYPIRYNINATWFVNAKPWFERLADALDSAQEEIYLTNWWTSPEVFLRRSGCPKLKDRFDQLLRAKAEQGVRIYMILWNETKVAQEGLMNRYAAQVFSSMHVNFKIMMHPVQEPIIWAHHQKTLVIDQRIAFQGGVDICWGRWDDREHRIADPCHTHMEWPGKDYFNPLIAAIEDTYNPYFDTIDRTRQPRMPWHDIHMEMDGLAARDVALNFIERWNNSRQHLIDVEMNLANKLVIRKQYPVLTLNTLPPESSPVNWYENMHEMPPCRQVKHQRQITQEPVSGEAALEIWNDMQAGATDPGQHENHRFNLQTCKVQVLRSISMWSGASRTEASIYLAYLDIINKAEHYILIENQYFCSNTAGFGVMNTVAEAIVNRVRWAIQNDKTFRVYLIIPAQPDGPLKDSSTVRCILFYTLETIFRSDSSIIHSLEKEFPHVDIGKYISVCSLRSRDYIDGVPVTEQVYVHAKAIICDDKYAIIGSANLNDRSFLGNRDSELAALVEDSVKVKSLMDGHLYLADRFAYTFRMFLFREFLGLPVDDNSVIDPVSNSTYHLWTTTAQNNTDIYRQVFPFIPSDSIQTWDQLKDKEWDNWIPNKSSVPLLNDIKGILIKSPSQLLNDGSLAPHLFDYEQKVLNRYIFQ